MPKINTRRNTNRIPQHNYSTPGQYFVTILTSNRKNIFGIIENGIMVLNECGHIANTIWQEIPTHFPDAKLDCHIIMPNHIHGIINIVRAADLPPLQNTNNNRSKMILSKIIHGVKSTVTRQINKIHKHGSQICDPYKIWQRNYHDHIIRNNKSLNKIHQYIQNNPTNWQFDIENPNRIGNMESDIIS